MSKGIPTGSELVKDLKSFALRFNQKSAVDCLYVSGALNQIEKELKALKVIKEKGLHYLEIALIKSSSRYENYIDEMNVVIGIRPMIDSKKKTKEEFDLLKEVLQGD